MTNKVFSFNTIKNFDDHILSSIPNYDLLFNTITILSDYFVRENTNVFDIGCSTGKLLKTLDSKYNFNNVKYIGYDNSINLLPKENNSVNSHFLYKDLNSPKEYDFENSSLAFSIFTLQFLNKEIRQELVNKIYESLIPGGAFIVAEKVFCNDAKVQDIFTSSYYDFKKKSFSEKEILDKEVDLRKILKPGNDRDLRSILNYAGFYNYVLFYKFLNFEAYLCLKD